MYERNAIVLERYFEKLFKYKDSDNLKENYNNYCKLVENLEKFINATKEENEATSNFEEATTSMKKIQKLGEKLYNKSAKLEYSRYIVFENKEEKTEEIENCLKKIEKDVEKNIENLNNLDKDFIVGSSNYKEKKDILLNCKKVNKETKENYEEILTKTTKMFGNILQEDIEFINEFLNSENKDLKKELNEILTQNGIKERVPFDNDVISNAIDLSFDIFKKEISLFLNGYEKTKKILIEIQENNIKIEKHKKFISDSNCKLHFLSVQKDYLIGFLDNERIAAIYDKKTHRKLMLEACRNLKSDLVHINSLYDLILKEASGRSSKRMYKDNYNINYLTDIEMTSEGINEEAKSKIKTNSLAIMNLNYWRIDGISRIQETFEKDVKEIYGRDLEEIFPRNNEEKVEEQNEIEDIEPITTPIETEMEVKSKDIKKTKYKKMKSSKKVLGDALYSLRKKSDTQEIETDIENISEVEEIGETVIDEEEDGEYTSLFEKISTLDELNEEVDLNNEIEEKSMMDYYFSNNKEENNNLKTNNKKINIFKKLIGTNSKSKEEA